MAVYSGCGDWKTASSSHDSINGTWRVTRVIPLDTYSPEADKEENDTCAYTHILINDTSFVVRDHSGNMTFDVKDSGYSARNTYSGCMCSMRRGFGYRYKGLASYKVDSAMGEDDRCLGAIYRMSKTETALVYRSNYGYDNCGDQDSIDFYLISPNLIIHDCGRLIILQSDTPTSHRF